MLLHTIEDSSVSLLPKRPSGPNNERIKASLDSFVEPALLLAPPMHKSIFLHWAGHRLNVSKHKGSKLPGRRYSS